MLIKALSSETLDEAASLLDKVFPDQSWLEKLSIGLRGSLIKNKLFQRVRLSLTKVTQLNYWVAVDDRLNKVIGITGLYCYSQDEAEAFWVGWLCVDPAFRGQKIGEKLLDFAINQARAADKKFLRLYTSTDPNETVAQFLYEKRGFRITGEEKMWGSQCKKIYRELELCNQSV